MYRNICLVTQYWPGINHVNVWEMPLDMWLLYLANMREIERQRER